MIVLVSEATYSKVVFALATIIAPILLYYRTESIIGAILGGGIQSLLAFMLTLGGCYVITMTENSVIITNQMLSIYKRVIPLSNICTIEYLRIRQHNIVFYLKNGKRVAYTIIGGDIKQKGIERIIEVFEELKSEQDSIRQ